MDDGFTEGQPIYRQLRDRVIALILDGVLGEGEALPSVRTVAVEFTVNPLTVLKAYQQLADDDLVESKRGRGMFVMPGARARLLAAERERFLKEEWPRVIERIERLGLTTQDLMTTERPSSRAKEE